MLPDGGSADAKLMGYATFAVAQTQKFRESFRRWFARPRLPSPLSHHVCRVVGFGADEEMGGVETWRIVAAMENAQVGFKVESHPKVSGYSVNTSIQSLPRGLSVPMMSGRKRPVPAAVRVDRTVGKQPCLHLFSRLMNHGRDACIVPVASGAVEGRDNLSPASGAV